MIYAIEVKSSPIFGYKVLARCDKCKELCYGFGCTKRYAKFNALDNQCHTITCETKEKINEQEN